MRSDWIRPSPVLAPYVDRVWSWEGTPDELPVLLPGTGAELVVQHGAPMVACTSSGTRELPAAHLLCMRRSRWRLSAAGPVRFTAVRFRAGALPHFTSVPVAAVMDDAVAAVDVFGVAGRRLAGEIRPADPLDVRARTVEALLTPLMGRSGADRLVEVAVRRTYYDAASVRVNRLGPDLGLSVRHLRRGFLATVGVPPKEFQRLARFQRSIRALLNPVRASCLPVALAAGYFDQSHFIKEFHHFTGQPPARMLGGPVSHFYYPSTSGAADA
ncbi:AraC family transcriptional regulator [Actinoplanes ianthinogenes]|uniref:AraC family transcriptional regulator n=1 Tax=Actinoplanes ianthinogenes TaxID=122358 RepID=A0ABN6CNZ5_9ACTN|nr:helix-turn-helix domain-containing protein [Actinoplanes ianthinogenes]BCJ46950.1 AraC family transcriptional regulator [Actinoplanes ianthinogenes]GGR14421.1 AraC family transcriptional regulator [Actinoplanes ianthinogenes]